ncbi:MAG: septum site-determining protein MinC [Lachnospiraceae bacterium]|nr:septum site-determining protein MinC [Lachnospiraceae bacterium]
MKDAVVIKSYQNGILLLLNPESSFEEILDEVTTKFTESKSFFGDARMALSIDGKELSDGEQLKLVDAIRNHSNIQIVCVVGKDEATEQYFIKALEQVDKHFAKEDAGGQFYKGTLKNKQIIETEQSIVILGDVYPGSAVISAHDIIVLGGLYGEAYAGGNGEEGHYIVALEMAPERLKVGDFKYKSSKPAKWGIKPKIQPQIAYVKNDKLVLETLTKELLSAFEL